MMISNSAIDLHINYTSSQGYVSEDCELMLLVVSNSIVKICTVKKLILYLYEYDWEVKQFDINFGSIIWG